jgi:hypothetical protein
MLYSFILETVIFAGIGALILILARALPRIEDETISSFGRKSKIVRAFKKIPLDKIDDSVNLVFHKILRKIKIIIMRADNVVTEKINNVRSDSNKKPGSGLPT